MFETRLKIILILFIACWAVVVLRLFQLQVVKADHYRSLAEQRITSQAQALEPIRGRILDRNGRVLAADEPTWAVALHYRLLLDDSKYLTRLGRRMHGQAHAQPDHVAPLQQAQSAVEELWLDLANVSNQPVEALQQQRDDIVQRIQRWKQDYLQRAGIPPQEATRDDEILEERECHPVIPGLDNAQQLAVKMLLWDKYADLFDSGAVTISTASRRVLHGGECLAHVLGGLGAVTEDDVRQRPYRQDGHIVDPGGYKRSDRHGVSGVEELAEKQLRGMRGALTTFLDERPDQRIEPRDGDDVALTLDYELQRQLYELLGQRVQAMPMVPGGSVVVVDISTRQVLALVSYPAYDPQFINKQYDELSLDSLHLPLLFRAIGGNYQPGSIMKPLTIVAALSSRRIDPQTTYECRGALFPNRAKGQRRRCWVWPSAHGVLNSEQAIVQSCNVFCFRAGEALGVDQLCNWFDMAGIGQPSGIGLREEAPGVLPTSAYLAGTRDRAVTVGDARNFAIGQGELLLSPIQAANLIATYASGIFQEVTLLKDAAPRPSWRLPVEDSVWQIIRRGMYGGVNSQQGTSLAARLKRPDYALCGKSGSAETSLRVLSYRIQYLNTDGTPNETLVPANYRGQARQRFLREHPEQTDRPIRLQRTAVWPPVKAERGRHTHAWFVAFLQKLNGPQRPDWNRPPRIAIAVLLEFGGSGGRNSGPLCRDVARLILDEFPQYVEPTPQLAQGRAGGTTTHSK